MQNFVSERVIRQGKRADIPFVLSVEKAVFSDPWSEAAVAAHVKEDSLCFLVFEENGCQEGYLLGSLIPPEGEIYRVATHPSFRRRGAAEALCRAFLSLCESCYLEVRRGNAAARALYEKIGFSLVGERKNYYKNPTEDACLYKRQ